MRDYNPYSFEWSDSTKTLDDRKYLRLMYYFASAYCNVLFLGLFIVSEIAPFLLKPGEFHRTLFMISMVTFVLHSFLVIFVSSLLTAAERRIETTDNN